MVCFVWQSCKMMQSVSRLFYYCVTVCFQPGSAMFCGRQSFHLFFGSLFSVAFFVSTCIKILWSSSVWPVRPTPKSYRHSLHQEDPDLLDTIPSPGHKIQGVQNTKFQNCTASINRTHIGYTNSLPLALNGMSGKTCLSKHSGHLGSSDLTETKILLSWYVLTLERQKLRPCQCRTEGLANCANSKLSWSQDDGLPHVLWYRSQARPLPHCTMVDVSGCF